MIQFSINSFSNGLPGRPYKSINEAMGNGKQIRYLLIMYLDKQLSWYGEQQADRHRYQEQILT